MPPSEALAPRLRALALSCLAAATVALAGCATNGNPRDPLEPLNRGVYQFNEVFDHLLAKPAAEIYQGVLPDFVRKGVSNAFSNINDVIVAVNNVLQGKFSKAASDVGRIAVNTTIGLLGIFDPATDMGLEKNNEDFGQTLGYWGIGDGPYLVLPFLGPSSLRDTVGWVGDFKVWPISYVDPDRDRWALITLRFIGLRAELLNVSDVLQAAALDPYEFLRDAYLQRRRNLVYDGNPPPESDALGPTRWRAARLGFPDEPVAAVPITGSGATTEIEAAPAPAPEVEKATHAPERPGSVVRVWLPQRN